MLLDAWISAGAGPVFLWLAITAVIAYFLGCFNGAVIVSKYILHNDVRKHGSGNAGLTNFYRTFGGPLTLVVILTDVLKAVFAILIGYALLNHFLDLAIFGKYWSGFFCLLGHMFPFMFHFKGGKGILSGGTMALMIDWRVALCVWGGFFLLAILTRYVSLGSIWAAASFPFASWFVYHSPAILVIASATGGLVLWRHRANILRLVTGKESKFTFHHKKRTEGQQ